MKSEKILITGANGQIGTVLTEALRETYGVDHVIASDIRDNGDKKGRFTLLDVMDRKAMQNVVQQEGITQIYHLAAILSARGEQDPVGTWEINMGGFFNVLETAKDLELNKVFFPSSIAVFGSRTPRRDTGQEAFLDPETVYGISKTASEYWCQYYHHRYGVDVRSVRYPGIIGYQSLPGGGTTDYAIDIFHKAVQGVNYNCFLEADTCLPMLYMEDAVRATLEIMEAPAEKIKIRTSYNLAGMSFTPSELADEIRKHIPDFSITYEPDFRQKIAEAWSESVDDTPAREDWGWQEKYDLAKMTEDMLVHLREYHAV
jgi:threonine 3-dehydrogenase